MKRRSILTAGVLLAYPSFTGAKPLAEDEMSIDSDLAKLNTCKSLLGEVFNHINKIRLPVVVLGKNTQQKNIYLSNISTSSVDCQQFCDLAGSTLARRSILAKHALRACGDALNEFAALCTKDDDALIEKCAKSCVEASKMCYRRL